MGRVNSRRVVNSRAVRWPWSLLIVGPLLLAALWAGILVAAAEGAPPEEGPWPTPLKELSLAVPSGNGYYPRRVAVAPGTNRVYTLNEGTDETGNTISVLDGARRQVVDTYALGTTDYELSQLAVAPTAGKLYALTFQPTALHVIATPAGKVEKQIDGVLAVAVDDAAGRLYLADSQELRVLATEDSRELDKAALAPGDEPAIMAVDPGNDRLYLARGHFGQPVVEFYVASSLKKIATSTLGDVAESMAADPNSGRLYVAYNRQSSRQAIAIFNASDGELLDSIALSQSWGYGALALDIEGGRLFAARSGEEPAVVIFATPELRPLAEIPLYDSVQGLDFDPVAGQLYALDTYGHRVLLLDAGRKTIGEEIYTAVDALDLAVDAGAGRFYVSDSSGRSHVFDSRSFAAVGSVAVGGYLSTDAVHGRLYAGQPPKSRKDQGPGVAIVDTKELRPVGHIPLSGRPLADPAAGQLYIISAGIYVADPQAMTVTGRISNTFPIPGGFNPNPYAFDAALDPQNRLLYAIVNNGVPGSNNGNYLYTFDLESGRQILTDTERSVRSVAVDPAGKRAYVSRAFISSSALTIVSEGQQETARLEGASGDLAVDPRRGRLYLCAGQKLLILDANTLDALAALPLDGEYSLAALDAEADRLYFIGSRGRVLVMAGHGGMAPPREAPRPLASPQGRVDWIAPSPDYGRDKTIFAARQSALQRSTDDGRGWEELRGGLPPGEWANSLAFSPAFSEDKTLFAALSIADRGGGLYKSEDGGLSWRLASIGLTDLAAQEVVFSPDYGRDRTLFARTLRRGLFRSRDGGEHWESLADRYAENATDWQLSALALSPNYGRDKTLLIGVQGEGFFRSTDGGETWQEVFASAALERVVLSPNFGADRTIFVTLGGRGLFRSEDGGENWQAASLGLDFSQASLAAVAVSPDFAHNRTLYALISPYYIAEEDRSRLYRSTDAGRSWQELLSGPPAAAQATSLALARDAAGDEVLFLGTMEGQVLQIGADDASLRWGAPAISVQGMEVSALAVSPAFPQDRTGFALGAERGLLISTDGGETWQLTDFPVRSGLGDRFHLALSPDYPRDGTIFVGTSSGLYRSRDGGESWQSLAGELPAFFPAAALALSPDYGRDGTLYAGGDYRAPTIYVSRDGGESWRKSDRGLPGESAGIQRLALSPDYADDRTAYAWVAYGGLFKTDDGGQSWRRVMDEDMWYVQSMALSPGFARDRTMFIGLLGGQVVKSQDGGATWQTSGDLPDRAWVTALALSPAFSRDNTLFIGTDVGAYRSDDGGRSWQSISKGLPTDAQGQPLGVLALALSPDFARDKTLFAGLVGGAGVCISRDGGTTWQAAGPPGSAPRATAIPYTVGATPEVTPTPCPPPPAELTASWERGRDRLGCPSSSAVSTFVARQSFQRGQMFWREDDKSIYALLEGGTWRAYKDTYAGEPEAGGYDPPSPGLVTPARGFGKVWREQLGGATAAIGWGTGPEQGFQGLILACESGLILQDEGGHSYLLYGDGGWEVAE
jgi:photosystem II stability/assembly factor-like uncharacterized protein/DNA-binding beta-propeller fold protein YncE